jgi:flagellar biosynthesis GTPase FlhF
VKLEVVPVSSNALVSSRPEKQLITLMSTMSHTMHRMMNFIEDEKAAKEAEKAAKEAEKAAAKAEKEAERKMIADEFAAIRASIKATQNQNKEIIVVANEVAKEIPKVESQVLLTHLFQVMLKFGLDHKHNRHFLMPYKAKDGTMCVVISARIAQLIINATFNVRFLSVVRVYACFLYSIAFFLASLRPVYNLSINSGRNPRTSLRKY